MIPMIMRIFIVEENKKKANLVLPLFFLWLLLLPIVILLTLVVLLAALILWPSGYGKTILRAGAIIIMALSALSLLRIDVEGKKGKTLIWFR